METEPRSKSPWWLITLSGPPKLGYVLGLLCFVVGVAQLVEVAVEGMRWLTLISGVYFTLWGPLLVVGAHVKSQRQTRRQETLPR